MFIENEFIGVIDIAQCGVPCPPLFSLGMAEEWECMTDHKGKFVYLGKYDTKVPFTDNTPFLDVLDLSENVDKSTVPAQFMITGH